MEKYNLVTLNNIVIMHGTLTEIFCYMEIIFGFIEIHYSSIPSNNHLSINVKFDNGIVETYFIRD